MLNHSFLLITSRNTIKGDNGLIEHQFQGLMHFSKSALATEWGSEVKFLDTVSTRHVMLIYL